MASTGGSAAGGTSAGSSPTAPLVRLPQDGPNELQTAYQIAVTRGSDEAVVWDSDEVASSAQAYVAYGGPALADGSREVVLGWPAAFGRIQAELRITPIPWPRPGCLDPETVCLPYPRSSAEPVSSMRQLSRQGDSGGVGS